MGGKFYSILLEDGQHGRLKDFAYKSGVTMSAVIRAGVELMLCSEEKFEDVKKKAGKRDE